MRQARLDAQQWKYQLEQCRNELAHKSGELQQLQERLEGALRQPAAVAPAAVQVRRTQVHLVLCPQGSRRILLCLSWLK